MSDTYGAQEAQDLITLEVTIEGFENWRDAFAEEVELTGFWRKRAGKDRSSYLEVCDIAAKLNRISREVQYFSHLINKGYILEEAVVTFANEDWGKFGKCTWIKNHANYSNPEHFWRGVDPEATDYMISFIGACFETELAGEQFATLTSTAIGGGFLFHKTLRFHRMVFSKPRAEESIAA